VFKSIERYIKAKRRRTRCMQKRFKVVCHNCKSYVKCNIYEDYVNAWMGLQKSYRLQKLIRKGLSKK